MLQHGNLGCLGEILGTLALVVAWLTRHSSTKLRKKKDCTYLGSEKCGR